ncbi:circularly permuted type 2 ATP-grasp protein [Vreelandella boliviensis]|uniref:circularly permuted type 2 ATP-grasp protein n=1 Tax=Vreelandella boliviensis TaxID=223527 RepID=UPI001B8CC3FF|nr:circularly permuted type 2 ATP-grasp protein [Halomonas boliviensis]MBS3669497.1 circularly permuted type 2 ATP-grasp protein [Halomonas boliviensis]
MTAPVSTSLLAPVAHGLVEDYLHQLGKGQPGTFDAMLNGQGQLRPGWQSLLDSLEGMGSTGRLQQHEEIQRLLAENGVIFNMHDETQGRSWRLDPLPWVIDEPQWHALEAGLIQRSRLLSALYDDIYGPKTLFETGLLPSQALLASPHFLLPCHRSLPTDRAPITSHGVDVIQDTQGQWRVIADRLQAPSGTGFALENRILMARALPDMYRNAPLKRLAGFLDLHHRTLIAMAYQHRDNPTLILLTPGPGSPRYFEHAYLANYLNIALVEGQDLVVRDAQVWLRTLGGLQPVDVILRHCDDAYCDPLELRGDSQLGVPGLLQAMRAGGVALSNALGVGILEAPVLADYLPMLCEHLLGEPLLLPNADATTQPATAPVFDRHLQRLEPTRLNLRCFVTRTPGSATAKNSATAKSRPVSEYQVMPGGLAWVGEPGSPSLSSTVVKDVWVTAASPQPHVSQLRQARGPVVATRDGTDLPSRVAESLFWLGRYGERLDTRARLLREALLRLMEYDQDEIADQLLDELLLALDITTLNEDDEQRLQAPLMGFELKRAALLAQFDNVDPQALQPLFAQLMRNARSVRDHLGDDSWRVVHQLRQRMATFNPSLGASAARRACEGLSAQLAAFFGLCNETMPHHYGWRFMDIGRFLDRVLGLLSLLKLTLNAPHSPGLALWEVVLATTDNFTAYRRRYRSELHPTAILDLLLFDETNPRSVGYMLKRIERQMDRLPGSSSPYRNAERRLLIQANAALHLADIDRLSHLADTSEAQDALAQLLDALIEPLSALSEAISQSHFSHVERPRQLVSMEPDV